VDNHFSMAVTAGDGEVEDKLFLVNPCGWHWSEVTATSLVLCDPRNPDDLNSGRVERTAYHIHGALHELGLRARVVLHTHMPYTTALTVLTNGRLEMCQQNALYFHDRISYNDEYRGLVLDEQEGRRIATSLRDHSVLFLAGHGVIVVGSTVQEAFNDLYFLEQAARVQVIAASTSRPLRRLPEAVIHRTAKQAQSELPVVARRYFDYIERTLRREEPNYLC
jgi:ribulose-5-phosphate 4-epimerase/fuculose-1-phosphate aldolase